jgi:phosphate butyryltransferase
MTDSQAPLSDFDTLYQTADRVRAAVPVVAVGGAEPTVLHALRTAADRGWIVPLVAGSSSDVRRAAESTGVDLDGFTVLDAEDPARAAVAAVKSGQARMLMKGHIDTPALLRAMLDADRGLQTGRVICQVVLMEVKRDQRRFLLADTGICIRPTQDQKLDILRSAVQVAHRLGTAVPRVAVMAASESVRATMPETLDASALQRRSEAGECPGCVVQGPLSFDLAYAADVADRKRILGPVTGSADVMLFPDLSSANLTVKAIMYTADCRFGGVLCGAECPVVFMSRADSTTTRLNSLAFALRLMGLRP